ncbi:HAD family phosphatase [uncultured Rothia sp.]|uniref:HAD family hydrolase n=1 Tax=uncultured Rothia sp. TaxID=316088 RepID=UPI0032180B74
MFSTSVDSQWFPTCAVFDCDGVLLDSEKVWEEIQQETFQQFNIEPTTEILDRLVGSAASDLVDVIVELTDLAGYSEQEKEEFYRSVAKQVHESEGNIIERGLETIPGALDLIKKLSAVMPVAVASNSSSDLLTNKLTKFGHREYLTAWVGAHDVENPKPAPDLYLEAIKRLDGEPSRTFTVEDSRAGAQAAQGSGAVTFIFTQNRENAPSGDGYFGSFTDPDFLAQIDSWIERLKAGQE